MTLTADAQATINPETPARGVYCYDCNEFWSPDRMLRRRKKTPGVGLCRQCHSIRVERGRTNRIEKRQDDKRRRAAYTATRSAADPKSGIRSRELEYGLQEGDLDAMVWLQDNLCAICGKPPDPDKYYGVLVVDHDHASHKVRGLLCGHCNCMLGYAKDSGDTLRSAADYLAGAPA